MHHIFPIVLTKLFLLVTSERSDLKVCDVKKWFSINFTFNLVAIQIQYFFFKKKTGNKRITDVCFKFIDKNSPSICHIYMVDCNGITDGSLKSLSSLKQLTVLNLANCVR